jgi:protein transport protein SEC24
MGPAAGGFPAQPATSPGRRTLDPDQMPSPIQVMEEDQKANGGFFDTREKGQTPPLVTTQFVTRDYGNASPRLIRSTMYYVPSSEEMRKQTGVPFGLVISPLAKAGVDEVEPPVTDFGPSGPVRCIRCKAYMSSLMQFIDGGRRFQCAFCKATTEVPSEYFQHLDHNGQRVDKYQRAELCLGTYECVATKDYCRDGVEPNVPAILFAIDVSYPMVKEGIVQMICSNMKEMLKHLPRDMHCDKVRILNIFVSESLLKSI